MISATQKKRLAAFFILSQADLFIVGATELEFFKTDRPRYLLVAALCAGVFRNAS